MGHPILKPVMPKFDGLLEELRHEGSSSSLPTSSPAASSHLPVALSEVSPGDRANNCRVCGHALNEKDDSCGNCGMPAHSTDDGMQSKWASMWFMQRAKKAVGSEQNGRERMWPLEEVKADSGAEPGSPQAGYSNANDENQNAENQNADTDAEAGQELAGAKRGPRSVLSVLKLHFKGRG
jgi:hypothetical protein